MEQSNKPQEAEKIEAKEKIEATAKIQSDKMEENTTTTPDVAPNRVAPHKKMVGATTFPAWYDYLALLAMFLIAQLIIGWVAAHCGLSGEVVSELISGDADSLAGDVARRTAARATAIGYFVGMSLMVFMTLIYRQMRGSHGNLIKLSIKGLEPVRLLTLMVVVLAASVVIEPIVNLLPGEVDYNFLGRGGWALLSTVIFAPLFEEVIFRGVILGSVRSRSGVIAAWLISSLCFGLAHGVPSQIVATFVIGLILGYAYLRSGSLLTSMALHAMNNALAMLMIMLGMEQTSLSEMVGTGAYLAIYSVSALIFIIWIWQAVTRIRRMRLAERTIFAEQEEEE